MTSNKGPCTFLPMSPASTSLVPYFRSLNWIIVLISLLFVSCTSSFQVLTPAGKTVGLMQEEPAPAHCMVIGKVEAVTVDGPYNPYRQAVIKTRNFAARMGATHVRIETTEASRVATTLHSQAFRCMSRETTSDSSMLPENLIILD